jgi:hypothetical protein
MSLNLFFVFVFLADLIEKHENLGGGASSSPSRKRSRRKRSPRSSSSSLDTICLEGE